MSSGQHVVEILGSGMDSACGDLRIASQIGMVKFVLR